MLLPQSVDGLTSSRHTKAAESRKRITWIGSVLTAADMTASNSARSIQRDPGTLYLCDSVEPKPTGKLRELVEAFTLKDLRSRYRAAAAVLSTHLPRKFDGIKPMNSVVAHDTDHGKTTLVNTCSEITSGLPPVMYKPKARNNY